MKVAVTGGSGQLGSLVVKRLCRDRAIESVTSIDLRPPLLRSRKLHWVECDVRDPAIGRHFAGCDAAVHLAYMVSGYYNTELAQAVNITGSRNVLTQAADAGVSHLLFCSSVAAYGSVPGHPVPLMEDSPRRFQPEFGYAATKFTVEAWLDAFEQERPTVVVSRIRPAILIGARMPNLLGSLLRARLLPDMGSPLPVVWDEDVVEAIALILKKRAAGAFNLAATDPLPARDLAAAVHLRRVGAPPAALARPLAEASRLAERLGLGYSFDPAWISSARELLIMDSRRARDVLGWKPQYPTTVDVLTAYTKIAQRRTDPRLSWFFRAVSLASRTGPKSVELSGMKMLIQLTLTGPDGGDYTIRVNDGRLRITSGLQRPADSAVTMTARLFLKLLCARASWGQEELAGRIRTEGLPHASMVLAGIIAGFRSHLGVSGPAGWVPRLLGRWIAQKGNL